MPERVVAKFQSASSYVRWCVLFPPFFSSLAHSIQHSQNSLSQNPSPLLCARGVQKSGLSSRAQLSPTDYMNTLTLTAQPLSARSRPDSEFEGVFFLSLLAV